VKKLSKRNLQIWFISIGIFVLLILSGIITVFGQGYEEWSKDIGGEDTEHFKAIQETSDNGFIVVGYVEPWTRDDHDLYIVKTDHEGTPTWSQIYGDMSDDDAYDVIETNDGYLVVGETKSYGAGLSDLWIIKTDQEGEIIWEKILGGEKVDAAYSVIQNNDEYIIAGSTASYGNGSKDVWVLKTNDNEEILWNITIGGSKSDKANEIIATSDGGYLIVGETSSYGAGWVDIWLIKLNDDGSVAWNKTYGGSVNDFGKSVKETSSGFIIAGNSDSFDDNLIEGYIINLDTDGNIIWEKTYGGSSDDLAESIEFYIDDGYLITGYTTSTGTGESDIWLFSVSPEGELIEESFYGGSMRDRIYEIQKTSDGGYILVGFTWSYGPAGNGYLIKITMEEPEPISETDTTDTTETEESSETTDTTDETTEDAKGIPSFPISSILFGLMIVVLLFEFRKSH
jgi:hypothetical protein